MLTNAAQPLAVILLKVRSGSFKDEELKVLKKTCFLESIAIIGSLLCQLMGMKRIK